MNSPGIEEELREEVLKFLLTNLEEAVSAGRPDAADLLLRYVLRRVEVGKLNDVSQRSLETILTNALRGGLSLRLLNPPAAGTKPKKGYFQLRKTFDLVVQLHGQGASLTENDAFERVGNLMNKSASTVSRDYYEYVHARDAWLKPLVNGLFNRMNDQIRHKEISTTREFELYMECIWVCVEPLGIAREQLAAWGEEWHKGLESQPKTE